MAPAPRLDLTAVGGQKARIKNNKSSGNRGLTATSASAPQLEVEEASQAPQVGSVARSSTFRLVGGEGKENNDEEWMYCSCHRDSVPDEEGFVQPHVSAKVANVGSDALHSTFADDNCYSWLQEDQPEPPDDVLNHEDIELAPVAETGPHGPPSPDSESAADKEDKKAPEEVARDASPRQWSDYEEDEDIGPVPDFSPKAPSHEAGGSVANKDTLDKVVILEAENAFLSGTRLESKRINHELHRELNKLKAKLSIKGTAKNVAKPVIAQHASSVLPASSLVQRAISGAVPTRGGAPGLNKSSGSKKPSSKEPSQKGSSGRGATLSHLPGLGDNPPDPSDDSSERSSGSSGSDFFNNEPDSNYNSDSEGTKRKKRAAHKKY
ncbi:unnamed protein product [Cyclocybe aegerita]|uniref:Uncharacterized protein n=1 Tax=Cyclocybe aegerita TaxID=1973307 RepID=A0A8S0VZB3_CYCAE|nr:unnamed protein product [Cyclocybe aegerita]